MLIGLLLAAASGAQARAQGLLVMYCGVDKNWCRAMATTYAKETGVKVDMIRMSAGETYARMRADPMGRGRQYVASFVGKLVGTRVTGFELMAEKPDAKWSPAIYALRQTGSRQPMR
ncbi:MAG: hypothetical protein BGP12_03005 [Rhodospirillales bacterium 70-18]|nr:MAG: hypothetical protein BGP12_03005 [Rhodospirillales bacterium 70-18]